MTATNSPVRISKSTPRSARTGAALRLEILAQAARVYDDPGVGA